MHRVWAVMMEAQAPTGGRASTQLHTCSHMQPGSLWRRNGAITGSSSSGRSHHVHCIPPQRKSAPSVLPSAQHTTSRLVASAARDGEHTILSPPTGYPNCLLVQTPEHVGSASSLGPCQLSRVPGVQRRWQVQPAVLLSKVQTPAWT